mmetsp:Transcript_13421/g.18383  ORF Transcript_13421/g.18383 Transcript_13421/m.18383 type:complete len:116 (-) Transcript_13421:206-553(-)
MQQLYEKYSEQGLEILAFPCNNFGAQEPGSNMEILKFAESKGASFPVFGKLECENGDITHPLYVYLKSALENKEPLKWNFAKFLCDSRGIPIKRFGPRESPLSFENHIVGLLESK